MVPLEEEIDGGDVGGHQVAPRRLGIEGLLRCKIAAALSSQLARFAHVNLKKTKEASKRERKS